MVKRFRAMVFGKVQGVFYRASALERAEGLGLKGFVRNLPNGFVELEAEGEEKTLNDLLRWCQHGPPGARVDEVKVTWVNPENGPQTFELRL